MGIYFNPTNESFTQAKNSMIYVDKTENFAAAARAAANRK